MNERRNYYRILGVQPDAPAKVIRGAYRTLMQKLQVHPDLGGEVRNAATVNAAWHVLRHPSRRADYDRWLLEEYDIRDLAGATPAPTARQQGNRRNYYRVLGVQPDAPLALIQSAYRIMSRTAPEKGMLLNEAYDVLSDGKRRRQYDRSLAVDGHSNAAPPKPPVYKPVILRYCDFCKTPHSGYPRSGDEHTCIECGSPLQRPAPAPAQGQRQFDRMRLGVQASLYEFWRGPQYACRLEEVTPIGVALSCERALTVGQVIRIGGEGFDAVARVVHTSPRGGTYHCGLDVLSVAWDHAGMLVDALS